MPDKTGLWGALGTPRVVRIITLLVIAYALVIGSLVVGYVNVSRCVADYSDQAARATIVRNNAAAQDRELNAATDAVDNSDRVRLRADQNALLHLIKLLNRPDTTRDQKIVAFNALQRTNEESSRILAVNDKERARIIARRRAVEAQRAASPLPAPPSETC